MIRISRIAAPRATLLAFLLLAAAMLVFGAFAEPDAVARATQETRAHGLVDESEFPPRQPRALPCDDGDQLRQKEDA